MNKSDSERIAGYLDNLGYIESDDKYGSDLVFINTCGVRQSAEDRAYGIIPGIKKRHRTFWEFQQPLCGVNWNRMELKPETEISSMSRVHSKMKFFL